MKCYQKWIYYCIDCKIHYDNMYFKMDKIRLPNPKIYENSNGQIAIEEIVKKGVCKDCSNIDKIKERWKNAFSYVKN